MNYSYIVELAYNWKKRLRGFSIRKHIFWALKLQSVFSRKVYLIGVPEHTNIGDNAIALAEIAFLQRCGIQRKNIICITEHQFRDNSEIIKHYIGKNGLILLLGGGNMGNQWYSEEMQRRKVLALFAHNPCVIFPQTIYYQGVNRDRDAKESIPYYKSRTKLTIVAREKTSYDTMAAMYPGTVLLLTPDIVLSTNMLLWGVTKVPRKDVLFCIRADSEKNVDDTVWITLEKCVEALNYKYQITDMHSDVAITDDNRQECVLAKMKQFCGAKLVITDRLHAMIFATITETPCVVFSNYNHKIKGSYEWIKHLKYIKYVDTVEEAKAIIPELLNMNDCHFDSKTLKQYFDILESIIRDKII